MLGIATGFVGAECGSVQRIAMAGRLMKTADDCSSPPLDGHLLNFPQARSCPILKIAVITLQTVNFVQTGRNPP